MRKSFRQHPRSYRIIMLVVVAIILGVMTPFQLVFKPSPLAAADDGAAQSGPIENQPSNGELKKGTPDYDTVLPSGKNIQDFGGWTRVSPPNRNAVYAYADKIGAIPINVSQQPLPKDFSDQTPEQIQLLARGYAANKKLSVEGAIVYIGTSAKGPQSVIVVKDDLLILIKASAAIKDGQWEKYIGSLR